MNKPLFNVIFKDNTNYLGNKSYYETGWLTIPINKPIKRIFYLLPTEDYICLDGYSNYFRMSEAVKVLTGKSKGQDILKYDYIIGIKKNIATSYRITLTNHGNCINPLCSEGKGKFKIGDVCVRNFNMDDKFIKGLNLANFRPIIGVK